MGLTIADVLRLPGLNIQSLGGETGCDRPVHWAQVCEHSTPGDWVGPHELVMSSGIGLSRSSTDHVEYIEGLVRATAAGLLIGQCRSPWISADAVSAADELGLPVLLAPYSVSFGQVSRAIAAQNSSGDQLRLTNSMRVYESYRRTALKGGSPRELLESLSRDLRADVFVLDVPTGRPWITPRTALPEGLLGLARDMLHQVAPAPMPPMTRNRMGGRPVYIVPADDGNQAVLVACAEDEESDISAIQHAAALTGLAVQRLMALNEAGLENSSALFERLIGGGIDSEVAITRLAEQGLGGGPFVVAAADALHAGRTAGNIRCLLRERGIQHLVHQHNGMLLILTPSDSAARSRVTSALAPATVGFSELVPWLQRLPDAIVEAQWALEAARSSGERVAQYGAAAPSFLPKSVREAEVIVERTLGSLITYDERHSTEVLRTLEVFFQEDRSWQLTADRLCIHRQTLVYRMKRIEELTGKSLASMKDSTELYLAIQARRLLRVA